LILSIICNAVSSVRLATVLLGVAIGAAGVGVSVCDGGTLEVETAGFMRGDVVGDAATFSFAGGLGLCLVSPHNRLP
jgi:hypothetical protein